MTMSNGIKLNCPVCGGAVDCQAHWLGWTEDGRVIVPNPQSIVSGVTIAVDESKHLIFKTGVSMRVYRRE
jgi:hypothetical protein